MLEKNLCRMLNFKNRVVLLRAKVDRIVCEVIQMLYIKCGPMEYGDSDAAAVFRITVKQSGLKILLFRR